MLRLVQVFYVTLQSLKGFYILLSLPALNTEVVHVFKMCPMSVLFQMLKTAAH